MENIPENSASILTSFEDFKHENGITYWWASEFMTMLGYVDMKSFKKVLDKATTAFISLGINHHEQIILKERTLDNGKEIDDYKMTRFACYMVAMNGDPKKVEVASAQAFFAQQARAFALMLEGSEDLERIRYRDEFSKGSTSLMGVVKKIGIVDGKDFANFTNAGYLGLYNKTASQLKNARGLGDKDNLQDYMGRTELAANLFRVTQTEERIKQDSVKSIEKAFTTHKAVSMQIRSMVKENTGRFPEELSKSRRLPDVKKELKKGKKLFDNLDKKGKK
ncbi:MAG: BRO family protein [Patescibacteria group bacterium]